jgi:hypothetical protein
MNPDVRPSGALGLLPILATAGSMAIVVGVVALSPSFTASARPLIDAAAGQMSAAGVLMRPFAAMGSTATALKIATLLPGLLSLALLHVLGRRFGLGAWAALLPVATLVWPAARSALVVTGAEPWLAAGTLAVAVAAFDLSERPARAAVVGGCGLAITALAHPLGLCASAPLIVLLAMVPDEWTDHGDGGETAGPPGPTHVLSARPIWLAWLAALVVAAAVCVRTLGDIAPAEAWNAAMSAMRARLPMLADHSPSGWPWMGPLFVIAASVPPIWLILALWPGADRRSQAGALHRLLAACVVLWLAIAVIDGRPTTRPLEHLVVIAPLIVCLAVGSLVATVRWLAHLWPNHRLALAVVALGLFVASSLAEGLALHRGETRTFAARMLDLRGDADGDRPAFIDAVAMDLLGAHNAAVSVLPGRRDGDSLAAALVRGKLLPSGVRPWHPFATGIVLLATPTSGAIASGWASMSHEVAGGAGWSLRAVGAGLTD